ncbi:MAG: TetR/AcrR family transcriptional regulator [Eubacteriales bacterium]|nr:TetR/AcrR family transcriptional regulator [Eubacteriales bacterium]
MSVPDRSIDPRLSSAAKKEFLEKGYELSSLAEICRAAGVTTGALYKRYEGKEALFSALVSDTIRDIEEQVAVIESTDLSKYTDRELYESLSMTPESIMQWMKILYEHKDGFTLLVRCSSGTRYRNFHHDWADKMNVLDYKYYMETRRRGMTDRELTMEEMHILTSAVWALYYEPFYHDFSWEQIERHAELMHAFINWPKALGLKKPKEE